jgi:hypothetical protein
MEAKRSKPDHLLNTIHQPSPGWRSFILFMMLAVCYSVILRYFWNELSRGSWKQLLMLYITFLGTAWLQRQDGRGVDLFSQTQRESSFVRAMPPWRRAVGFILTWKGASHIRFLPTGVTIWDLSTPQCFSRDHSDWRFFVSVLSAVWRLSRIAMGMDNESGN